MLVVVAVLLIGTPTTGFGQSSEWSRFRGPDGSGSLSTCDVPLPWTSRDIAWTIDLPGSGNSSPILHEQSIYLLSADPISGEQFVLAYDQPSGKPLWQHAYASEPYSIHKLSSFASSTPCADDRAVYVAWATPDRCLVKAIDHSGTELWTRDLGPYVSQHGFGTSPIVAGDQVFLMLSQDAEGLDAGVEPGESHMIALDRLTGKTRWKTPLASTSVCYGVPQVRSIDGQSRVLGATTREGFFALDTATGKKIWSKSEFDMRICSSLLVTNGLIIASDGSGGGGGQLVAIKSDGSGEEVFRVKRGSPYVPTPVASRDHVFLWSDKGIVSCVTMDGEVLESKRIGGNVYASPILLGDKLLNISQDGVATILSADADLNELGSYDFDAIVRATPAASADALFIRTDEQLLKISR